MNQNNEHCIICNKPVESGKVECSICKRIMHRECMDEEVLVDSEGNTLCPYCAAIAALDWFDAIVTEYVHVFTSEEREDLIKRLESYIALLKGEV